MGKLHKKLKKLSPHYHIDKDSYEAMHPYGTGSEAAYDAAKDAEKELKEAEKDPSKDVIPMPDEDEIARARRRRNARMRSRSSSAATDLTPDEGFGG